MARKKRTALFIIVLTLLFSLVYPPLSDAQTARFSDVPVGHRLDAEIHKLRELNITQGVGQNNFGLGRTITRGEFVTYLVRLMQWDVINPPQGSFLDNMNTAHNFYGTIETALQKGAIKKDSDYFHTDAPITREEMAVMIVRTLGYDTLAGQLNALGKPFDDVTRNFGYITIGKDLGIIAGKGNNKFGPLLNATREEAAAMMIRMYNKLNAPISELHGFYAISSSKQINKIPYLDSISFGWARLEYDQASGQVVINTDAASNEYNIPTGYASVIDEAQKSGVSRQLMFFVKDQDILDPVSNKSVKLGEYIVSNPEIRKQIVNAMTAMVNRTEKHGTSVSFDGLVSDFEGFKGEALKSSYNAFLTELKAELAKTGKKLYVAVHPKRKPGQAYFDGYDYGTIGEIADKVILMAHDYEATYLTDSDMQKGYTDTPVTPFDEIYYALKSITDPDSGVRDRSKIWLQLSMDSVQWQLKEGKVINREPYHPDYEQLIKRFLTGVDLNYSEYSQNPYATFINSSDNTYNVIWYENERSIAEKIKLARMFGIQGLSLWRLGNIPERVDAPELPLELNIWNEIIRSANRF